MRQLLAPASAIPRKAVRPRSSSVSTSNFKNTLVKQELGDTRALLTTKDSGLRIANDKLARTQTELIQSQNERIAMEKKLKRQINELEASLEEKEDELEMLRAQQGDGGREREEELMKRVEEDEAKIMALERLVGESHRMASVKDALERTERQLKIESKKVVEGERRCVELVREKEEALDELEAANIAQREQEEQVEALVSKDRRVYISFDLVYY